MITVFDLAFDFSLEVETTKYTNDPKDPGGPTKFGITLRTYQAFVGRTVTPEEIEALTIEQAKELYRRRFWEPLSCGSMQRSAIAIAIFDCAVLYGVMHAGLLAQRALSSAGITLKFDGLLGDKSIAALNLVKEEVFLKAFYGFVISHIAAVVEAHPNTERFKNGWTNRANRLLTLSDQPPQNEEAT